jgi:hypothetical protein
VNAIAKRVDETPANVIPTDASSIMAVIARASADPNTDVDKLERLLGMYERITAQQAKASYVSALAEMQPRLPVIDRKGRIVVPAKPGVHDGHSTPYALWEDINDAIRPILHEHGFALSFRIGLAQDGKIDITGVLSHRDGHQEETTLTLMHDSSGSKNSVQAVGSSTSYGKRYTAMALLNITSRTAVEKDDDGRMADEGHYITDEQVRSLDALIKGANADRPAFLKYLGVADLKNLPANKFTVALNALQAKKRGQG